MKYFKPLMPFIACWILLLNSNNFQSVALINGIGQLVLFLFLVCIPIWRTGRMSYVDIGWPLGVALIGIITMILSKNLSPKIILMSSAYMIIGFRMGIGVLNMWRLGLLRKEFSRYQYQKIIWKKSKKNNTQLAQQVDAISQGFANATFLSLPALMIWADSNVLNYVNNIIFLEFVGLFVFVLAIIFESIADIQKINFNKKMKKSGRKNMVCDIGLWKYTRHPNYFAEWMVWNGLIIASIPSYIGLYRQESFIFFAFLGLSLIYTSRIMYLTLVYLTGAIPSEYYSVQKRPDYKAYQESTNMFFPGSKK
jgi:steroid 5-alpha reductase family enzyme